MENGTGNHLEQGNGGKGPVPQGQNEQGDTDYGSFHFQLSQADL